MSVKGISLNFYIYNIPELVAYHYTMRRRANNIFAAVDE
jgi:hypothetical protein